MIFKKVTCKLCNKQFGQITHTHLVRMHNITLKEYIEQFPDAELCVVEDKIKDNKQLLLDAVKRTWVS